MFTPAQFALVSALNARVKLAAAMGDTAHAAILQAILHNWAKYGIFDRVSATLPATPDNIEQLVVLSMACFSAPLVVIAADTKKTLELLEIEQLRFRRAMVLRRQEREAKLM